MSARRKSRVGSLILMSAVVIGGCAPGGVGAQQSGFSGSSLEASIERAREEARGKPYEDFLLSVLEDGMISESEMVESQAQVTECVRGAGVNTFEFVGINSGYKIDNTPDDPNGEKANLAVASCEERLEHIPISLLYNVAQNNPRGEDPNALIAACLIRREVVEPSYSAEDFTREFLGYMEQHSDDKGSVEGDPTLALSYTVPAEEGGRALLECMNNPLEGKE